MTTEAKIQLTSTELGTLWMTYIATSAKTAICEIFRDKTIDKEAKDLLTSYLSEAQNVKDEIDNIFKSENAVIPIAFNEQDIICEAPSLFDDIFHVMFFRQLMKIEFGHMAVDMSMSYMKEVQQIFKLNTDISYKYYVLFTEYLLGKGVLARPPYITMPRQVEFIEDKSYISGINFISDKRTLNTIETGYINEAIENNILAMQLGTGFAQVAKEREVKDYFVKGTELAKKIITELSSVLLQSDIQPPSKWAGKATDSTMSPFSDKLLMYITNLIASTGIGYDALGTSFSMRSDLHVKLAMFAKDAFDYAKEGAKIMISHKWMEEPPQMEDRKQLVMSK